MAHANPGIMAIFSTIAVQALPLYPGEELQIGYQGEIDSSAYYSGPFYCIVKKTPAAGLEDVLKSGKTILALVDPEFPERVKKKSVSMHVIGGLDFAELVRRHIPLMEEVYAKMGIEVNLEI